jgi:hypothetical protein
MAGGDVDGAGGLALVVDVDGPAADMAGGAVMGNRGAGGARGGFGRVIEHRQFRRQVHGVPP